MRRLLTTALVIMLFTAGMSAIALAGDGEATTRTRQAKVDVCHYEADTGAFDLTNISTKAHQKHMDHGDGVPGDHVPGMAGYEFDETCELVQSEIPGTLFAVAYTDIDPSDGGYDPNVDVLISKLVDTNNDGVVSVGDTIEMGQYPKNFNPSFPTDFGNFAVVSHTVDGVINVTSTEVAVLSGADPFSFISRPDVEQYWEGRQFDCHGYSQLLDATDSPGIQAVTMNGYGAGEGCQSPFPESRSLPDMTIHLLDTNGNTADEYFLDVEILITP